MSLYKRRQLLLILLATAAAAAGLGIDHWRRARPELAERLETLDRAARRDPLPRPLLAAAPRSRRPPPPGPVAGAARRQPLLGGRAGRPAGCRTGPGLPHRGRTSVR